MEPTPRHYEKILSGDLDLRQPVEDLYFQEDHRGSGWKQHAHIPEEVKDYRHSVHGEPRHPNSNRSRYEGKCTYSQAHKYLQSDTMFVILPLYTTAVDLKSRFSALIKEF